MIKVKYLADYIDEFIEEKQEVKNLTNDTAKKQAYNISRFIIWLQNQEITELNHDNIRRVLRQYRRYHLKEKQNKRTTVKTYLLNVIDFLNYDEIRKQTQHKKIKIKEIIEVKTENQETARKRIEKISLTKPQSDFFLNTILKSGNIRDYAICKTFIDTGIRLKELVLLNKTDIQAPINNKGFYVLPNDPSELINVHLRPETTKGQYKDRTTFITCDTLISINAMIMRRIVKPTGRYRKKPIILKDRALQEVDREELFTTVTGHRFTRRGIQDVVKKYAKQCDERILNEKINCNINYYRNVSVHTLRHTALSYYAEVLTVSEVQSIAGHANSSTTDRYIHTNYNLMKNKIKEAMQ